MHKGSTNAYNAAMWKKPSIYLIRHGETQSNIEDCFTGQLETPLTANGIAQAHQTAANLKKEIAVPDVIYTSPLSRAYQTALIICNDLGLDPQTKIRIIPELIERNSGALSGLSRNKVREMFGDAIIQACDTDYDARPPATGNPAHYFEPALHPACSESLQDVENRVHGFVENTLKQDIACNKTIFVVGHQNNLRPILRLLTNMPKQDIMHTSIPNATPIKLERQPNLSIYSPQPTTTHASLGR